VVGIHARHREPLQEHEARDRLHQDLEPMIVGRRAEDREHQHMAGAHHGHRGAQELRIEARVGVGEEEQLAPRMRCAHARRIALARPVLGA
jgi:hypothetical protein